MSEERITQEDLKVLAEYGRTMLSVQLFELILMGLVQINQPEPPEKVPFEEAWKQVQPIFEMTAGQLRKELEKQGSVPDDLLDEIQIAVNTRNKLAHYYLLEFRIRSYSAGGVSREAVEEMVMVRALFRDLNVRLDALMHQRAKERGWDLNDLGGLTEQDLRRIAAEVESDEQR
jgi:hypothetical protein